MNVKTVDPSNNSKAFKAGVWYVVSSIIVRAIAVISTPIFTRLMTTEEFGTNATFISWYSLLLTFCTLNLSYSIGRAKLDYPNQLENYIGSMQVLSGAFTLLIVVISCILIKPISSLLELDIPLTILLMIYLLFTPSIIFIQNGYRYRYKYKQNIAIAWYISLSTVFLSLILVLILPFNKAISRAMGIVIPNIVLSVFFWIKSIREKKISVNIDYWKYGLSLSLPLVLHTVSMNILSQADRIYIAKECGNSDVGIYSLVYSYGILISIITNAVSDAWLPWFHDNFFIKNYDEINKASKKIIVLGCFLGMGCISLAPEAVSILGGPDYYQGLPCVLPIVLGIVCQYIYTHYVNIEMHLKKTKYVSYGTIIAALLNIVLNAIFIPIYGFVAAAYTTLASYFALMLAHFFITRLILHQKLYDDVFMFGSIVITGIVSALISLTYNNTIVRYSIIGIGLMIFVLYFRNYIFTFIKKYLKRGK